MRWTTHGFESVVRVLEGVRRLLLLSHGLVLLALRGREMTLFFTGALREGLVTAAGLVGGIAWVARVLA